MVKAIFCLMLLATCLFLEVQMDKYHLDYTIGIVKLCVLVME